MTSEWDVAYEHARQLITNPATRERGHAELIELARKLVRQHIRDKHDRRDSDAAELAAIEDDALLAICAMADNYTPGQGVTFRQYVTARRALWRTQVDRALSRHMLKTTDLTRAEHDAWRLAQALISDYVTTHGYEPDDATLNSAIHDAIVASAESEGISYEAKHAKNKKSGFDAACRNIPLIRRTRFKEPLENAAAIADVTDIADAITDSAYATTLAALAGDTGTTSARSRVSNPHAQWLHLAPASVVTIHITNTTTPVHS